MKVFSALKNRLKISQRQDVEDVEGVQDLQDDSDSNNDKR